MPLVTGTAQMHGVAFSGSAGVSGLVPLWQVHFRIRF